MKSLSKKWFTLLALLAAALIYIGVGLIFFRIQNWQQCLSKFTGNACSLNQMMPVVLLPVGLIVLIGLFTIEPMFVEVEDSVTANTSK